MLRVWNCSRFSLIFYVIAWLYQCNTPTTDLTKIKLLLSRVWFFYVSLCYFKFRISGFTQDIFTWTAVLWNIFSKSGEDREEVDGDKENLLDTELLPAEELPDSFPISLRNLETDPFLRIQREEPETWAASVPEGVASALKPHEAKRQEHIYEFIITEKHHCQLLKVIQKVFCEGMTNYLDMKPELLDRLFPQLDTLISLHFEFLRQLRERQV